MIYLFCMTAFITFTSLSAQSGDGPIDTTLTLAEKHAQIQLRLHLDGVEPNLQDQSSSLLEEVTRLMKNRYRRVSVRSMELLSLGERKGESTDSTRVISRHPETSGWSVLRRGKRPGGSSQDVNVRSAGPIPGWVRKVLGIGRYAEIARDPEAYRLRAWLTSGFVPDSFVSGDRGELLEETYQGALLLEKVAGDLRLAGRRYRTIVTIWSEDDERVKRSAQKLEALGNWK